MFEINPDAANRKMAKRRAHRKSRLGCQPCKQRRIKCDETQPACKNCTVKSLTCEYKLRSCHATKPTGPLSQANDDNLPPVARPYPAATDACPVHRAQRDIRFYSMSDAELMHHYTAMVAPDSVVGELSAHFWHLQLPRLAFQNAGLLHLVLAYTAYHAGIHARAADARARNAATAHFDAALAALIPALNDLSPANRETLHAAAVLICICHFAKGPQPGDYIAFATGGPAQWFSLLRGVKALSARDTSLPTCALSAIPSCGPPTDAEFAALARRRPPQIAAYKHHFRRLRDLFDIIADGSGAVDVCVPALDALEKGFDARLVWSAPSDPAIDPRSHLVFNWLFRVSDAYVDALQARRPLALVIFGYFAVLMTDLENQWLFGPWPSHVMKGVEESLPERYQDWLDWPKECIRIAGRCRCDNDGAGDMSV